MARMSCVFALALLCAALPAPAEPQTLSVGYCSVSEARLALGLFHDTFPELPFRTVPINRDIGRPWFSPLAMDALPTVVLLRAGALADDVRPLADRGLLTPADELLKELGIAPDAYRPGLRAPLTRRDTLWAIPHHAAVPMLRFNRAAFEGKDLPAATASWAGLLKAAKDMIAPRGTPGPRRGISVPGTTARFAEMIALASGAPPLRLDDPALLASPIFENALHLVLAAKENGAIIFRQRFSVVPPDAGYLFGVDYVDCVKTDAVFGALPFPTRLADTDAAAKEPRVPGMLEAIAVTRHAAEDHDNVLRFLRWITSPEMEIAYLSSTQKEAPPKEWLVDGLHVPLRTLETASAQEAIAANPDLAAIALQTSRAYFPANPATLENAVWELVEARIDYLDPAAQLPEVLKKLHDDVVALVQKTPVEAWAYQEY